MTTMTIKCHFSVIIISRRGSRVVHVLHLQLIMIMMAEERGSGALRSLLLCGSRRWTWLDVFGMLHLSDGHHLRPSG